MFNIFGEKSIYHENQAFDGSADQSRFLKMFQKKGFSEILNYAETKFNLIRQHYIALSSANEEMGDQKKSLAWSNRSRIEGNNHFNKKNYRAALTSYNEALCFAETREQRSLCYGNISAIYFALKNPDASLDNIKIAKKMHARKEGVDKFLEKLESREASCNEMLKIPGLQNLVLTYPEHEHIPGLAKTVGIREQHTKNQHLFAKESMKFGDVIAVTESIQVGLDHKLGSDLTFLPVDSGNSADHFCYNCGVTTFYVSFPCDTCSIVQFCSEACKTENMEAFHRIECDNINYFQFQYEVEKILAIRLAFRFLKSRVDLPQPYTSCFDWTDKGTTLSDKIKSVLGFRDRVVTFDDAFLLTKRMMGAHDIIREKPEYKDVVDNIKDGSKKLWDLYGRIYRKMGSGSFLNNMTDVMHRQSKNALDFTTNVDWLHGLIKHSCAANVMVYRPKHANKNFYVLLDDIKAGQELTIGYM